MSVRKPQPGDRFGRLTVIGTDPVRAADRSLQYRCECDCGGEAVTTAYKLRTGHTGSCGCLHRQRASEANIEHGFAKRESTTAIHRVWRDMQTRCYNTDRLDYQWWGARGIRVCDEWRSPGGFPEFLAHVSSLPHFEEKGYSLDRIDNDGNYEPGNVRWATQLEQQRNRRKRNVCR